MNSVVAVNGVDCSPDVIARRESAHAEEVARLTAALRHAARELQYIADAGPCEVAEQHVSGETFACIALAERLLGPMRDWPGEPNASGVMARRAAALRAAPAQEETKSYCSSCGGNGWIAEGDEQIGCVSCNGTGDDCSAQPARCPVDKSNPLRRFVRHHERCRIWEIGAPSCSCGLLSVLGMARPSDLDTAAQPSAIPCPVDHSTCSRCNCDTSEDQQVFVLCDGCYGATTRPAQPAPMPDAKAKAAFLEAQDSLAVAVWSQPNHTLHISDGDKLSLPIPFEIVSYYDPARVRTTLEVRAISAAAPANGEGEPRSVRERLGRDKTVPGHPGDAELLR